MANITKKQEDVDIIDVINYSANYVELVLKCNYPYPEIKPGQFVQVQVPNCNDVFLRRPFSVHDWDKSQGIISLYIKIIGKGTFHLSLLKAGDKINIIYPLGNGFNIPQKKGKFLLVGGGCGVAPLFFLAKKLRKLNHEFEIYLGAKTSTDLIKPHQFSDIANTFIATEDGSEGFQGLVSELIKFNLNNISFDEVIVCGPELMMKNIWNLLKPLRIPTQVSIEHYMVCGYGVCLCCVVDTINGRLCTCIDGPVFYANTLKEW